MSNVPHFLRQGLSDLKLTVLSSYLLLWQTPWPKPLGAERVYFSLQPIVNGELSGNSWQGSRNLEAGTEAVVTEECCSLLTQFAFLYMICPGWSPVNWVPYINQKIKKTSHRLVHWPIFQRHFPSQDPSAGYKCTPLCLAVDCFKNCVCKCGCTCAVVRTLTWRSEDSFLKSFPSFTLLK